MSSLSPDSWIHFKEMANASTDHEFVWRGQRDPDWPSASSLERRLRYAQKVPASASHLSPKVVRAWTLDYVERFRRQAVALRTPPAPKYSLAEWSAFGRHYGLTTRLLDWTEDSYVALAFAIYDYLVAQASTSPDNQPQAIAIYRLARRPEWEINPANDDALLAEGLHILPVHLDVVLSIQAQESVFTWLQSDTCFDIQSFLDATGQSNLLTKILIRHDQLEQALRELDRRHIDFAKLFPDPHGAALAANLAHMVENFHGDATNSRFHLPVGAGFVP